MRVKKLNNRKILELLDKHQDILKKYGVEKIGLFGSFARGRQKKNSDIDFLVEFELKKFDKNFKGLYDAFISLTEYLEKLFGRKVELITKDSLSPYIKPYIERKIIWRQENKVTRKKVDRGQRIDKMSFLPCMSFLRKQESRKRKMKIKNDPAPTWLNILFNLSKLVLGCSLN